MILRQTTLITWTTLLWIKGWIRLYQGNPWKNLEDNQGFEITQDEIREGVEGHV
jgi:hypothetical protein